MCASDEKITHTHCRAVKRARARRDSAGRADRRARLRGLWPDGGLLEVADDGLVCRGENAVADRADPRL